MEIDINPFIYGRALTPAEFTGRARQVRMLYSDLAKGQSVFIIGQPHTGKTSMLRYVLDADTRHTSYGERFVRDCFIFLDAQLLRDITTPAEFWQLTFEQMESHLRDCEVEGSDRILDLYQTAVEKKFRNIDLVKFFTGIKKSGIRLFLLLDEFDDFLTHPTLNIADFYGRLRSLASTSGGLILLVAARHDIEEFHKKTRDKTRGSPYFNIYTKLELGALSVDTCDDLFNLVGDKFSDVDREYVLQISGQHPYLFQTAAASLWNAIEDGKVGEDRYLEAGREVYRQSGPHFADTWWVWSNATRKAITAIALSQIPQLLSKHEFHVSELIDNLADYSPELENLKSTGIITENDVGEFCITQEAFLWWLADELRRNVRDDTEFRDWLKAQELDNLLTSNEREKLNSAVRKVLDLAGRGATTLIESLAKGFGEGYSKTLIGASG